MTPLPVDFDMYFSVYPPLARRQRRAATVLQKDGGMPSFCV
jgi:hypothetical protein